MRIYLVIEFDGIDYCNTYVFANKDKAIEWKFKRESELDDNSMVKYYLEESNIIE